MAKGKILEDEISTFPRQQPRDREPEPKPEPHVRTLLNGECRKLQRAQSLGGPSFRAPQDSRTGFGQLLTAMEAPDPSSSLPAGGTFPRIGRYPG